MARPTDFLLLQCSLEGGARGGLAAAAALFCAQSPVPVHLHRLAWSAEAGEAYLYARLDVPAPLDADALAPLADLFRQALPEAQDVRVSRLEQVFAREGHSRVEVPVFHYVVEMDPDAGWMPEIARWYDTEHMPGLAAVPGCIHAMRLLNHDHSVQTSCIQSFPTVTNQVLDADYLRDRFPRSRLWGNAPLFDAQLEPCAVDALSGACLAVTREAFEQIGGFTESYFMYGEDLDLCFKLQRSGYKVYYLPETRIVHLGGGSSRQAPSNFSIVTMRASVYHFFQNHRGRGAAMSYRLAMGVAAVVRLGLGGEEDDRDLRELGVAAQDPADLDAAQVWHHYV